MRGAKRYSVAADAPDHDTVRATLGKHGCVCDVETSGAAVHWRIDLDRIAEGDLQVIEEVINRDVALAISRHRVTSSPPVPGPDEAA